MFSMLRTALTALLHLSRGVGGVGLATRKVNLNNVPLGADSESWVLRHDGTVSHNNEVRGKTAEIPQEGDLIVSIGYVIPAQHI